MKYLHKLLHTKAPTNPQLLDIAIVLSIIPHLFVMKFFMLLYLAITLYFILKKNKKANDKYLLMLLGLTLISTSFFNSYNFSDFSRMQFFVSLISSLLIYAVSLQKLTSEVNFYLKISPAMLMVLSFFFFNSITMLLYSTFVIFMFTLLYVWSKMDTDLIEVFTFTAKLFIVSLPLVAILFLVFPRISIEKSDFGFRADTYISSGYDGKMKVGNNAIFLSNKIIMEVLFKDKNISDSQLYFRGSTLSIQDGLEWKKQDYSIKADVLLDTSDIIEYTLSIHPHAKKWVYALDMPSQLVSKTVRNNDYTLSSNKPLYEIKKFTLKSALNYKLYSNDLANKLTVDKKKNERIDHALKSIKQKSSSLQDKAQALFSFFAKQKISYTLNPKNIDLKDFTDSFLFDSKNGYCVHFASSFATSARLLGIPSRIVTGFKAKKTNMINNYLLVKSSDAHAWVELYFKEDGWVRFDPTSTALIDITQNNQNSAGVTQENSYLTKINHYYMYSKHMINNWVLGYDRSKQMAILNKMLNDTLYFIKIILYLLLLTLGSFVLYILVSSIRCKDKLMCAMQKLLKFLQKQGKEKSVNQTMQEFLEESQNELTISLENVNELYHSIKYKKEHSKEDIYTLKKEIKRAISHFEK